MLAGGSPVRVRVPPPRPQAVDQSHPHGWLSSYKDMPRTGRRKRSAARREKEACMENEAQQQEGQQAQAGETQGKDYKALYEVGGLAYT